MSHSAIYTSNPEALAVVHVHNKILWDKYFDILPTTSREIEYGTPAMAGEISRITSLLTTLDKKVIIMGGHEEGIIAFGKTVEEATRMILQL
jgi:ribulose-5-phosphate 4-epimerase/fuculose-1-phosphate aldolase